MQFGNPIFLWGLMALPIPLLIHLYFRRNRIRVKFSTVQFFRKREKFLAFRRRIRDLLLLLLRTLAVLFLVLALSRPTIGGLNYLSGGGTDTLIIIDDTLSMCRKSSSGETAYDSAKRKAHEIMAALGGGDAAAVIFVSGRRGVALTGKIRKADDAVKSSSPAGCSGSFSGAFKQASDYLRTSDNPNREIFLISDFQASQIPSSPYRDVSLEDARIYFVPVSGSQENLALARVSTGARPKMVGRTMKIEYDVENLGRSERKAELSLEVNGRCVENRESSMPAGEKRSGEFLFVPPSEGMVSGSVSVKDDSYGLDNRRYFAVSVSKNIKVLGLYQDEFVKTDPYFFARHALDPDGNASCGIKFQTAIMKELTAETLAGTHVLFLADIDAVPEKQAALISSYLRKGGTVVSFPGARTINTSMSAISMALKKEGIPCGNVYGGRVPFKMKGLSFSEDFAVMNSLLQSDYIAWKNLQDIRTDPSDKILARASGNTVIAERKIGAGRWIAFACSARNDFCNWPELKLFPVVMVHLVDYAANGIPDVKSSPCGSKIKLLPSSNAIDVSDSSGTLKINTVRGREFLFEGTWNPGVVTFEGADIKAAVLNCDPEESKPEILARSKMAAAVIAHEVSIISPESSAVDQIDSSRKGSSLAGFFLVLLFIAALAEFLIADSHIPYFNPSPGNIRGGKS